ncbi:putative protease [Lachnospiraceae bacterium NK3A20]|jgi:putative protease|nr:putative protease [Lachnospiraceae bacterium NK3A20]
MSEMKKINRKKPELLCPAKDLEVLKTAVDFGADAVYIGGEAFGLRAKARNFNREEMAEGIRYAHAHGARVHVTANILAHDPDLAGAAEYFRELEELRPDAVLVADPGMFALAKENCPDVEIHISTQANNTNYGTFNFWAAQGAKRVVCARELSLAEIREIRDNTPKDLEIEAFVHGAMCISYSGRCLLSNYFTGRDANHGECTHPCRWKYAVMEESRPGEYLPIEENERGTFIFNSRDLCMIEHIPELVEAGIDSLKIEGRMKTALYVATVARTYRKAIDDYFESEGKYRANMDWYREEIRKCTYRRFTTGFYFGKPSEESMVYDSNTYVSESVWLGIAEEVQNAGTTFELPRGGSAVRITQRNKFSVGDGIELMKPDGRDVQTKVVAMINEAGEAVESAPHPKERLWIILDAEADQGDLLRTETNERIRT